MIIISITGKVVDSQNMIMKDMMNSLKIDMKRCNNNQTKKTNIQVQIILQKMAKKGHIQLLLAINEHIITIVMPILMKMKKSQM